MNKLISMLVSLAIVLAVTAIPAVSSSPEDEHGAVYTMTNEKAGNQVSFYDREADGTLSFTGNFATDGLGTGTSLGNQGGVMLSEDGNTLLVANAGSNDISTFLVTAKGLKLTDKINSGGNDPISITIHKDLVYVLNAGGKGNIAGFHLSNKGKLSKIPGLTVQYPSGPIRGFAEIAFNPDGNVLAVTEKLTNMIDIFTVDDGIAHRPISYASNGQTPFGFAFDKRGQLIVSEATASDLSSYAIGEDGNLETISGSVLDSQIAACWVAVTKDGKFAYTNNAHSGTISSYKISKTGKLSLLKSIAGTPGTGNIDLALSKNSKFLYSLNSGDNTIAGFKVNPDGSLTSVGMVSAPAGANGLAAH